MRIQQFLTSLICKFCGWGWPEGVIRKRFYLLENTQLVLFADLFPKFLDDYHCRVFISVIGTAQQSGAGSKEFVVACVETEFLAYGLGKRQVY